MLYSYLAWVHGSVLAGDLSDTHRGEQLFRHLNRLGSAVRESRRN